jgi:hypothetical protein
MKLQLITPDEARTVARTLFVQLHRGEEEWFDAAWNACLDSGRCEPASNVWEGIAGLGAVPAVDQATRKLAKDFVALAASFLIESPVACQQLLERLQEQSKASGHVKPVTDWLCQRSEELFDQVQSNEFQVWESLAGIPGTRPYAALSRMEVTKKFRQRINDYDIFIDCGSVWVKKRGATNAVERPDLCKHQSSMRLLTILLMHRHRVIDKDDLCRQAMGRDLHHTQAGQHQSAYLGGFYSRISRFRKWVGAIVPELSIEADSIAAGYRCSGSFSSCVILAKDIARFYQVDLL